MAEHPAALQLRLLEWSHGFQTMPAAWNFTHASPRHSSGISSVQDRPDSTGRRVPRDSICPSWAQLGVPNSCSADGSGAQ
jgi:hypothetical protein